ncbi:MAG: molecular chaperone DnaJ, partial [Tomitella sp.]|nr:molecular chaperone DnaJ [Tomitella sp.]
MARDYYALLGVDKDASDQELKRAYRKLARELHPDVNPDEGAQARFREVTTAYEVLTDPEKRRVVDLGGDPMENAASGGGFGGGGFGGFGGSGGLGDVFEAFFGGAGGGAQGPRSRVQPGSDALLNMSLTLEECATGLTREITVDTAVLCDECTGKGTHANSKPSRCSTCGGAGQVQSVQRSFLGQMVTMRTCPSCRGVGEIIADPCRKCSGDGRVRTRREITIKVPAGVGDGMRIRLSAQGEVGPGGGPAGDLYVEVDEQQHNLFVREDENLHCNVSVPMADAALGTTMQLDTLIDGQVQMDIDAGTLPGQTVRMA